MKNLRTAVAAALLIAPAAVNASTITFDDLVYDGANYREVNPIESLGFRIRNEVENKSALGVWPLSSSMQADYVGHAAVFTTMGWTTTTMTSLTPQAFNFYSIDLADVYNNSKPDYTSGPQRISFTFRYALGGTSSQDVITDAEPGLETFVFNEKGLQSVSWVNTTPGDTLRANQFDNVVASAVPESESCAMLVAGLGLLGVFVRRKRARSLPDSAAKKMPLEPRGI